MDPPKAAGAMGAMADKERISDVPLSLQDIYHNYKILNLLSIFINNGDLICQRRKNFLQYLFKRIIWLKGKLKKTNGYRKKLNICNFSRQFCRYI